MRAAVSGVRSSCDASATRRRCAPTDVLERREHRVESRREPAELVAAVDRDALGQVAGLGDRLGGRRQAANRPQRRGGDERRERGRDRDPDAADQEDPELDAVSALSVGARSSATTSAAARDAAGDELPQVVALDRRVEVVRPRRASTAWRRLDQESAVPCVSPSLRRGSTAASGRTARVRDSPLRATCSHAAAASVDLVEQLVLRDDPHGGRGGRDRDRDRHRGQQRQLEAKAHGSSRNAYPTPRTVCRRRGSPPSSSLRRR